MNGILIKFSGNSEGLPLKEFLLLNPDKLNPFEKQVLESLKKIYHYNEEHTLFKAFPKREKPLIIDCNYTQIKQGWTASYAGGQNRIVLSHDLAKEDLEINLIHELKHAEQWFDDSQYNNYQRHQAYCLYEVLAKLFIGEFLGRGAYFGISLDKALEKWFSKHYPNYKEKYDKKWPISKNDAGLKHLPKSFGIPKNKTIEILDFLNKNVLKKKFGRTC